MRAFAWALVCAALPTLLLAETVTLQATRGSFAVEGELRSFDGAYYRLLTENGPVTLRAEAVRCSGAACPAPGETSGFTISTTHSLSDVVVPALVRAFAAEAGLPVTVENDPQGPVFVLSAPGSPARRFPIRLHVMSAPEVFADLAAQSADMVIVDRAVSEGERIILQDAGLGDMVAPAQEVFLALDGLAFVVSPRRAVSSVSLGALGAALLQDSPTWDQFAGATPGSLTLTLRAHGEDLQQLTGIFGPLAVPVEYQVDGDAVAQAVRRDPARLGVLSASERGAATALRLSEPCGLAHSPTNWELATARYPFPSPVKAYFPDQRAPRELREFRAFLTSETAYRVMRRAGLARPSAAPIPSDLPQRVLAGLRMAAPDDLSDLQGLVGALSTRVPIGLSIPSEPESPALRGLRRSALETLAVAIEAGVLPLAQLTFVVSAAEPSQAQDMVLDLLETLSERLGQDAPLAEFEVLTNGALLPVACPGAPWADWMNNRVDVWLRAPATDTPPPEN